MSANGQHPPLPNHVRYTPATDVTFGAPFGDVHSVTAISLPGLGHQPHIEVKFKYGLRLDLSPEVVVELARRFPEALAKLPIMPDVHDAAGGAH